MATGLVTWSKTAATNASIDSAVNMAEGMAPSAVNDSARGMMASVAQWRDDTNGSLVTTGGTTAYVLATNQSFAALTAGYQVAFQINVTNTAASTLAVDGLTAKPLRKAANVAVVAGDLVADRVYNATYFTSNSGEWLLHDASPTIIAADQVVTASILDANVTLAKMADLATKTAIGRNTGSTGAPEAVTAEQIINWIGTPARGDMLAQGASNIARTAIGTAGKVWTSDGTDPAWATPARILLATLTASSSAALSDTTSLTSAYSTYELVFENILPATNAVNSVLQVRSGGTFQSTSYVATAIFNTTQVSGVTTSIPLNAVGSVSLLNTGSGLSGTIRIHAPSGTAAPKMVAGVVSHANSGMQVGTVGGYWSGNGAVDGFQFSFSSGNIASGKIRVYGLL